MTRNLLWPIVALIILPLLMQIKDGVDNERFRCEAESVNGRCEK